MNTQITNNELTIIEHDGQLVTDSRQVAKMVDKPHDQLMRSIRTYIKVLDISAKLQTSDFFIESTYLDAYKREKPCYLITKKGCDMIANKMTGEKGILFSATYINKFYEMEEQLKANNIIEESNTKYICLTDKDFSRNKIKNTFKNLEPQAIPYVFNKFEEVYAKTIKDVTQLKTRYNSIDKGIILAVNNQLDEPLKQLRNAIKLRTSNLTIRQKNNTIKQLKADIEFAYPSANNFSVINYHPFTCNCIEQQHMLSRKYYETEAYKKWKSNFPKHELKIDSNIDFTKPVYLWMYFDHLDKFDVSNFSKATIDMIASIYKVDDKLIQIMACATNSYVDSYKDGKMYIFLRN